MEQVHHRLFCRVRVAQSSGFYVVFSEALFFSFYVGHCSVRSSSVYGF